MGNRESRNNLKLKCVGLYSLPKAFLCSLNVIDKGREAWEEMRKCHTLEFEPRSLGSGWGLWGFLMRSAVCAPSQEQAPGGRAREEGEEEEDRGSAAGTH